MYKMAWEILAGVLIFAAGTVAYSEIRRLIQFFRTDFKKLKKSQKH